jgi:hypothetical protein
MAGSANKKYRREVVANEILRLNLGSGYRKIGGYINIDNRSETEPDLLLDVIEGLPYQDDSVDEVRAWDFLEHIPTSKVVAVMEDIFRVLKPMGKFEIFVPSTDGRGAWQDPTHVSFWNANSFFYYMDDAHRNLYGIKAKFSGSVQDLITDPGNHIRHVHAVLLATKTWAAPSEAATSLPFSMTEDSHD